MVRRRRGLWRRAARFTRRCRASNAISDPFCGKVCGSAEGFEKHQDTHAASTVGMYL